MLRAQFFPEPAAFAAVIAPLVAADPDGAAVLSGVLGHLTAAPQRAPVPLMGAVLDEEIVLAAVLRSPGHPMAVVLRPEIRCGSGSAPGDPVDALVDALLTSGEAIVGFAGRRDSATRLAAGWQRRTGAAPIPSRRLMLHRLAALREPVGVPGLPRVAVLSDPADLDVLSRWWHAFGVEAAIGPAPEVPGVQMVLRGAARGDVVTLWCVQHRPVAAAGHAPVRNGACRIAPVYTPVEHRRHGYASAVTAAAVRSARSSGAADITLFTDAEYLPSNALYSGLGFEPVAAFDEYALPG